MAAQRVGRGIARAFRSIIERFSSGGRGAVAVERAAQAAVEALESRWLLAADIPDNFVKWGDTLLIPSNGSPVLSANKLTKGETYWLRASSTAYIREVDGRLTDAQYYDFQDGEPVSRPGGRIVVSQASDAGEWGNYEPSHVYTMQITGKGQELSAYFADSNYSDNSGYLELEIYRPRPTLTVKTCKPCEGCTVSEVVIDADGGSPGGYATSEAPVRYFDGVMSLGATDLSSDGFGKGWGHTRTWTNASGYSSDNRNGTGWVTSNMPFLIQSGSDSDPDAGIIAVDSGTASRHFDRAGGIGTTTYTGKLFLKDTLVYDSANGEYVITDPAGNQTRYYGFSSSLPEAQRGSFKSFTDVSGNVISVFSLSTDGKPTEVRRSQTTGSTTQTESLLYTYTGTKITSIVLRRQTNGGSWSTIRQVSYTYHDGTTSAGNSDNLRTATVKDGAGNTLDLSYYRYWKQGETGGYTNAIKYVLGPDSYARVRAALPSGTGIDDASDATIALYADNYFEYDSNRRVSKEVAQGTGCSTCTGGRGTFTYEYEDNPHADPNPSSIDYGVWRRKTTLGLPDGNQRTIYANEVGEVMLEVYKDTATGQERRTFYQYDSEGRLVLKANPSAVTGYSESADDLLQNVSGNFTYLADTSGLIELTSYYDTTTASSTIAGGVAGYFEESDLRHGETGSDVKQRSVTYIAHTAGDVTVYPVAAETVYPNDDGSGGLTTTHAYTWHSGTVQIQSETVTDPVVGTAQNGAGGSTGNQVITVNDIFGHPIWSKDGDGFLTYREYDQRTGAVTKLIEDVDTSQTSDFSNLPSGWTTSTGGGLHRISTMEVDSLGRTTKLTDPRGTITYTVYRDSLHEVRTYAAWDTTTNRPTGPTQVWREDLGQKYTETLTMSATPTVSGGRPTGTEAISNVQSLSRTYVNDAGQTVRSDVYSSMPGTGYSTDAYFGTAGTNYLSTSYAYDDRGRQERVQSPDGTITHYVYNGLNWLLRTWVGTNDTTSGPKWTEALNGTGTSNMVLVSENTYDGGTNLGDGNLTAQETIADDSTSYVTSNLFDWRDRMIGSRGADGVAVASTLDNLGRATVTQTYADGDADFVIDSGELRGKSGTSFDDAGRVYQTFAFEVDPASGTMGHSLTSNFWYNGRGMLIKSADANGLFSKTRYNGVGETTFTFLSYDAAESSYADADDVVGDTVIEQSRRIYGKSGNQVTSIQYQRFDGDTTTTGELTPLNSYIQANVTWFDKADRPIGSANYGRDNGSTRYIFNTSGNLIDSNADGIPNEAQNSQRLPNTSNDYIAAKYEYNDGGHLFRTTDNKGHLSVSSFDLLSRTIATIENYVDGVASETEANTDRTTQFIFDDGGRLSKMRALNPKGSGNGVENQDTTYLYQSPFSGSLITSTIYPDSSDTDSTGTDQVKVTYDRLGRKLTSTDQRGVEHTYSYDSAGRLLADAITVLPSGVDGSVRRIEYSYDDQSRVSAITSYDAASGGDVVNQIAYAYDGWGNVIQSWQAHDGAVTTSTPSVQYTYADGADVEGNAKYVRLTKVTYPDGREVFYNYPSSGIGDKLSRLDNIGDDASGTTKYVQYTYLGAGTIVKVAHPAVSSGLTLSYGASGTYSGWDRFGRVVQKLWKDGSLSGGNFDGYVYTYDRNSNVTSKQNYATGNPGTLNETYSYDGLDRLTGVQRNSSFQSWSLDSLGNWSGFTNQGTSQTRTNNAANEITGISGSWVTPTYDAAGNMVSAPINGDETHRYWYVFDAWNRIVIVKNDFSNSPGSTRATYSYDGLNRRVTKDIAGGDTFDDYFNENWQRLESRKNGDADPLDQFLWDVTYIDTPVLRWHDSNVDGDYVDASDNTLYYTTDANNNITGLYNPATEQITERYVEDPYGKTSVFDRVWASRGSSAVDNDIQWGGYVYDSETGNVLSRWRPYNVPLATWFARDFGGYIDGANLQQYVGGNPVALTDPFGFKATLVSADTSSALTGNNFGPDEENSDLAKKINDTNDANVSKFLEQLKPLFEEDLRTRYKIMINKQKWDGPKAGKWKDELEKIAKRESFTFVRQLRGGLDEMVAKLKELNDAQEYPWDQTVGFFHSMASGEAFFPKKNVEQKTAAKAIQDVGPAVDYVTCFLRENAQSAWQPFVFSGRVDETKCEIEILTARIYAANPKNKVTTRLKPFVGAASQPSTLPSR